MMAIISPDHPPIGLGHLDDVQGPPSSKSTRRRSLKPTQSDEHRIVKLARRCNLVARFDAVVKAQGGDYITIFDASGRVEHQCAFVSLAAIWLAKRQRAAAQPRGLRRA